jgi:hypothetical protein
MPNSASDHLLAGLTANVSNLTTAVEAMRMELREQRTSQQNSLQQLARLDVLVIGFRETMHDFQKHAERQARLEARLDQMAPQLVSLGATVQQVSEAKVLSRGQIVVGISTMLLTLVLSVLALVAQLMGGSGK